MRRSVSNTFGSRPRSASGDRQSMGALRVHMDANRQMSNIPQHQGRKSVAASSNRPSFGGRPSTGMSAAGSGRTSVSRYSLYGSQQQQRRMSRGSGMGVRNHTVSKDPRNLSDRSYQQKCIKNLLRFLTENQFPHTVSSKVLQSPTNADFMRIFEFIYGFSVVNCKVVKEDIPRIFKQLGYPYTLTKSSMMTIGSPHTWPTILAALNWMIELLQWGMTGDMEHNYFPTSEDDDFDSLPETKILFDYVDKTYTAYMMGQDTFEDFDENLAEVIKTFGIDIDSLQKENKFLALELESLEKNTDKLKSLEEDKALGKRDEEKFVQYLGELDAHRQSLEKQLAEADQNLRDAMMEAEASESNKQRLFAIFDEQKLSQSDIERIKMNQKELQRQKYEAEKREEEVDQEVWQRELSLTKEREKLESKCNECNKIAQQLKLIPMTADNAFGVDYELKPSYVGYMGSHFNDTIKPALFQLKKQCGDSLHNKGTQLMKDKEKLEQIVECVVDSEEEVRMEDSRLKRMEDELECKKQVSQNEYQQQQEEIEMLQRSLVDIQTSSQLSVQDALKNFKDSQKLAEMKKSEMAKIEKAHVNFMERVTDEVTNHIEKCQEALQCMVIKTEGVYEATKQESRALEEWLSKITI